MFEAPKDVPAAAAAGKGAGEGHSDKARVPWVVPAGWITKTNESGMRLASYAVTAPDGRSIDISVVALGEQAGSELDNVNRWRQQLKLEPVSQAQVAALQIPVKIGRLSAMFYDLASTETILDGKHRARTLAAMWPVGNLTVFFKAYGEESLVTENRPKFVAWLNSVETGPEDVGSSPPGANPPSAVAPAAAAPTAGASASELPEWQVPAGWKAAGPKPMRLASFEIPAGAGAPGDVSVSSFPGDVGGLLANVNRWRGQIGMAPTDDATLLGESKSVKLAGGRAGTLVDLAGGQEWILGAIVPMGDRTWFFKLKGESALVAKERANFVKFVESVKL